MVGTVGRKVLDLPMRRPDCSIRAAIDAQSQGPGELSVFIPLRYNKNNGSQRNLCKDHSDQDRYPRL